MLSRPLLATLLAAAPSGAMAFDAMDCVGTEICTDGTCTPSFLVYAIGFDWPAQAAIVETSGQTMQLTLAGNDTNADGTAGALSYVADETAALILTFQTTDITMTYTPGDGTTHLANCAAREAA